MSEESFELLGPSHNQLSRSIASSDSWFENIGDLSWVFLQAVSLSAGRARRRAELLIESRRCVLSPNARTNPKSIAWFGSPMCKDDKEDASLDLRSAE